MSFSRIFAVFLRQFFLIRSNPTRLASIFMWMLIAVIQWGFISKYLGSMGQATFGFVTVMLGAIILWEFMTRIQQGIMMAFLEDIWSQNFINYFASPLKVGEYLAGLVLTSTATSFCGFSVMILVSGAAFGYNLFKVGLLLLPFLLILYVFGMAVGIFVSGIIFKLGPSAEWLGWPIPMVLSIIAGVFYPIDTLPAALRMASKLIPAPYVFESMRQILSTGNFSPGLWANLGAGGVLAAVYLGMAYKFFVMIYGQNLKSGAIARFNAESL